MTPPDDEDGPRFTVLVSTDNGVTYRRHAGIIASSAEQAIERVRTEHNLGTDAEYWAGKTFRRRTFEREMIEKWSLRDLADLQEAADGE